MAGQLIFQSSRAGMVQVLKMGEGRSTLPGVISVEGKGNDYLSKQQAVIITSIGVNQEVNAQFVSSLQKVIYVYSFGDRMGKVTVNGLAFDQICAQKGVKGLGPKNLLEYYDRHRAIDEDRLMTVTVGNYPLQGYLTSMNLQTTQPQFKLMSFSLNIVTVPKQVGAAASTDVEAAPAGDSAGSDILAGEFMSFEGLA